MFLPSWRNVQISLFTVACIVIGFYVVGPAAAQAREVAPASIYEQTNDYRQEHGLEPLTTSAELEAAAEAKANHMIQNQYWSHDAPTGETPWDFIKAEDYGYTRAGENLAYDFGDSRDLFVAWTKSPSHNENLIDDFSQIGVASVEGEFLGEATTIVVALYASPRESPASLVSSDAPSIWQRLEGFRIAEGLASSMALLPYVLGSAVFYGAYRSRWV